jgi:hypothetical protein
MAKRERKRTQDRTTEVVQAGVLAWILPGAGHYWLGQRGMAAVFFVAITFPYLTGVAIGGIKNSINPYSNHWLFLAEMGCGAYTSGFLLVNHQMREIPPQLLKNPERLNELPAETVMRYVSFHPGAEVAQIYLAVAGLLNVLAILDAMARAQSGGLPVFIHEVRTKEQGSSAT